MARHPQRQTDTVATFLKLYADVSHMPWTKIEAAAGVSFSSEVRSEIFGCAYSYSRTLGFESNTASLAERQQARMGVL